MTTFAVWAALGTVGCRTVENRLLFHPTHPTQDFLPSQSSGQDVVVHTTDGTAIHARWCPHAGARGALLYCHGNAGDLEGRDRAVRELGEALGESVFIFDYPGFGRSAGEPSEAGCYAAAHAAFDWLTRSRQIPPENIILYGESLGGGVAVELANHRPHRALILVRTFTSIPDMAETVFPWLPVRWLVNNHFDNRAKIGQCQRPIFIAQGERDQLIPASQGRQLREAAGPATTFFILRGANHNDPPGPDFYAALREFLRLACP